MAEEYSDSDPQVNIVSNNTNPNNLGGTPASDDSSYDKLEATRLANKSNLPTVYGSNETETLNESFAGKTTSGSADNTSNNSVQKNVGLDPKPGTRLYNPLGNFSSYTYQISLYMITPDAHSKFVANGRKNINEYTKAGGTTGSGGAYVILQSGGVNTKLDNRPPNMKFDYYIDDLKITNVVAGKQTSTSSNLTKVSFNVIEPIGFSFVTQLRKAREALAKVSSTPNIQKALDPSKHFYVLGVRFQGYDANGEIANASKYFSDDTFNAGPDASGVYERFYDIRIQKISFKLGTGSTTYQIEAIPVSSDVGMNVARGTVDANMELVGSTVDEVLNGSGQGITSLFQTINTNIVKSKNREFPDIYSVRYLGTGSDVIKNARLKSAANPDKKKSAPNPVNNSAQVNENSSKTAVYDKQKVKIPITQGMPILQAIQKIVKQSSYLEDALEELNVSSETPNPATGSNDVVVKKDTPALRWYNVSTEIETYAFDTKINDFAYKITYIIQPYETPAAVSPNGKSPKYYGPHKRYQYWYTGKNTEVINFELQLDNTYYNVVFNPKGDPGNSGGSASIPQLGGKPTPQDRTGYLTPGSESQNTYVNSLFDPGAYSKAKLEILGDPDFLMRESPPGKNEAYKQFYQSDNFTINPNGGQVFIEVEFNEGIDYDTSKGTLDINSSIFFWNYPDSVKDKIKGLSYQVSTCESNFKSGKFTQSLGLIFNVMPEAVDSVKNSQEAQRTQDARASFAAIDPRRIDVRTNNNQAGNTPTPGNNVNSNSSNTGLIVDEFIGVDSAIQRNTESDLELLRESRRGTQTTQSITTGNTSNPLVANDDSVSNAGSTQAGISNQSGTDNARNTDQDNILNNTRTGFIGSGP
jgi:hypothetical protein